MLADIAARDLDTSAGPPLNAFRMINPFAVAEAELLDRKAAAGESKGPLFCAPIAVKDNFASSSGLPAVAFPAGLDARGLPVGLELMSRPRGDEALVAMMAAFERARGAFPPPRRPPGRPDLAPLDIARQNEARLRLGWSAYRTRHGKAIGALAPERFRALTDATIKSLLTEDR